VQLHCENRHTISPVVPIGNGCTLFSALEHMVVQNISSVVITSPQGHVRQLICMSDISKFLYHRLGDIDTEIVERTIGDLRPYNFVSSVRKSAPAINAFKMLQDDCISAVVVCDDDDNAVDIISEIDFINLSPNSQNYRFLEWTCEQFKTEVSRRFPSQIKEKKCVTTDEQMTVGDTLRLFFDNGIHRIVVTRNGG
jgi:CBS-domain-containing membrane protein